MKKILLAITGATGAIYGIRLLELLKEINGIETHLILSKWAEKTVEIETDRTAFDVCSLADAVYSNDDLSAPVSSGSYLIDATVILPCSMKTLSAIANGYSENLITRAADVAMKESRLLALCPRETPLSAIHLENMLKLSRAGVRIIPPMPGFYSRPESIDDLVLHHCVKVIDNLGLEISYAGRWGLDGDGAVLK